MSIEAIIQKDLPDLAALIALLEEHPAIENNNTLSGAVSLIKSRFTELWERLEEEIPETRTAQIE
jgi:hypothetical protein